MSEHLSNLDSATPRPLGRFLAGLLLLVINAILYYPTISFEFLTWDDVILVETNPLVLNPSWRSLAAVWTGPYIEIYMPITYSFWIALGLSAPFASAHSDAIPAPPAPWVYHLATFLLTLGVAYRLYQLILRFVPRPWTAAAATLLYALHPMQAESSCWISENKGLLGMLFGLWALAIYVDASRSSSPALKRQRFILATILFLLAILSKPTMVTLPLIALVLDVGLLGRPWPRVLGQLISWFILAAGMVIITIFVQPSAQELFVPWLARPYIAVDAIYFYLKQSFWPAFFCPDYARSPSAVLEAVTHPFAWGMLGSIAIMTLIGLAILFGQRSIATILLLYLIILAPNLGLVPFAFQKLSTVADRYGAPALVAVSLGAALLVDRLRPPILGPLLLAGPIVLAAYTTHGQIPHWRNQETLTSHQLAVQPHSAILVNNRAAYRLRRGQYESAADDARQAIAISRRANPAAYSNLFVALVSQEDWPQAQTTVLEMTKLFPDRADFIEMAIKFFQFRGEYAQAIGLLPKLKDLQPGNTQHQFRHARLLILSGQTQEGLAIISSLQNKSLEGIHADETVAQVFEQAGQLGKAIDLYQNILLRHGAKKARFSQVRLAWIFATAADEKHRDPPKAVELARQAIDTYSQRSNPTPAFVWDVLAATEASQGDFERAITHAQDSLTAIAREKNQPQLEAEIRQRIALYRNKQPYRTTPPSLSGLPMFSVR
jgi:tetratricopeptide (TPR) repeat protein